MAKALLGYVGGTDARTTNQAQALRRRVCELEAEVSRLQTENDELTSAIHDDDFLSIADPEVDFHAALS
jgi:hypothetical protein